MSEQIRPPVVTILGHVDHGKTSLLDFIRKSKVAAGEFGGITQAIGAYQVEEDGKKITFIDTPGHAAFEKMRQRGAGLADIAVLVVSVDDGIMPQTVEAIKHIQSAGVPMIVAVNKIDLPGINLQAQMEKIKRQLSDHKVLVEEYGGDTPIVKISAKTGEGIKDLLETITLVAEINELKGDADATLSGVVIESRMDKFKGPVATVLVRNGTLKKTDPLISGGSKGKVKGMLDWNGKNVDSALPSTPVEVLGFETVPSVGSIFGVEVESQAADRGQMMSLVDKLRETDTNVLNVIIRADKQGSLEAIESGLEKFNETENHIKILSSGTGDITDSDVDLASSSKAIILGFNVVARPSVQKIADNDHVLIRTYKIIYELLEEMDDVVQGLLVPGEVEEVFGRAQIVAEFPYGESERIAGCKMLEGVISKGPRVRVVRGEPSATTMELVGEGKIKSLKRLKEEVSKVEINQDCGIMFDSPIPFEIGDVIESFRTL